MAYNLELESMKMGSKDAGYGKNLQIDAAYYRNEGGMINDHAGYDRECFLSLRQQGLAKPKNVDFVQVSFSCLGVLGRGCLLRVSFMVWFSGRGFIVQVGSCTWQRKINQQRGLGHPNV